MVKVLLIGIPFIAIATVAVIALRPNFSSLTSQPTPLATERPLVPEVQVIEEITLTTPSVNQVVTSPLKITGSAQGSWYFEGIFNVELVDDNGESLGTANVQAQGEWMTEAQVPFSAE